MNLPRYSRRQLLQIAGCAAATGLQWPANAEGAAVERTSMMLGFSTYGMKSLRTDAAIGHVQRIGFDSIEITVTPEWDAAPANMPSARRKSIQKQIADSGLVLTSLMEHIVPSEKTTEHMAQMARLKSVFELAGDLAGNQRPLVQTVLGGGEWEAKKQLLKDRVGEWSDLAKQYNRVLAIKPHRGGAMSRPEEAVWLIQQLGKPDHLRIVYDYSHYAFRDMTLDATIATALPYLGHVAVKDPVKEAGRVRFQLPGEAGTVDYPALLKQLHTAGYQGDISCEVSGMVWSKPDYDPLAAAEYCHAKMAQAFEAAGLSRGV